MPIEYPPCENCGCSTSPRLDPRKGANPLPAHKCDPATVEAFKLCKQLDGFLTQIFEHHSGVFREYRETTINALEKQLAATRKAHGIIMREGR